MRDLHDLLVEEADRQQPTSVPPFQMIGRRARRRTWRNAAATVAAATVVVSASIAVGSLREQTTNQTIGKPDNATSVFDEGTFTFDYPSSWRREHYDVFSTFASTITYLSNDALHDPCSQPTPGNFVCAAPLSMLSPSGVLIEWSWWSGMFTHDLSDQPGRPTTLDGRPTRIDSISATTHCAGIGGEREVHAITVLESPSRYTHWLDMSACVAGPDTTHAEQQIDAMMKSLRFKPSGPTPPR